MPFRTFYRQNSLVDATDTRTAKVGRPGSKARNYNLNKTYDATCDASPVCAFEAEAEDLEEGSRPADWHKEISPPLDAPPMLAFSRQNSVSSDVSSVWSDINEGDITISRVSSSETL